MKEELLQSQMTMLIVNWIAIFSKIKVQVSAKSWRSFSSVYGGNRNDWSDDKNAVRNGHLVRSGQLGMCDDSYCTTSPRYYDHTTNQANSSKISHLVNPQFHNIPYGDAKVLVTRLSSFLFSHITGVLSPHSKAVQQWNRCFIIACLVAIFVDPLFLFLLSAIKFRLAFVAPESRVVEHPKKIALNYLSGYFLINIFNVMPVPQTILFILPKFFGSYGAGANTAKNILRISILIQYLPRLCRFLTLLAGQSPSGFSFESVWANFVINLLMFMLSAHVVGSCCYLFGLQGGLGRYIRVNQCLRDACHGSGLERFIDCGSGDAVDSFASDPTWSSWVDNANASACFQKDGFPYGIYAQAVDLITINDSIFIQKYVYPLFWGFQQISTLAGKLAPSYFIWEVLFTMAIIGLGLLLFALLMGNMQNFLLALGQRRLEMSLR